jgi:hypothetical protein
MCGRVVQKTPLSEIRVFFETVNPILNTGPTYNGAPTHDRGRIGNARSRGVYDCRQGGSDQAALSGGEMAPKQFRAPEAQGTGDPKNISGGQAHATSLHTA